MPFSYVSTDEWSPLGLQAASSSAFTALGRVSITILSVDSSRANSQWLLGDLGHERLNIHTDHSQTTFAHNLCGIQPGKPNHNLCSSQLRMPKTWAVILSFPIFFFFYPLPTQDQSEKTKYDSQNQPHRTPHF